MRANVFTDKALERQARRFVWLAIDTEKSANAFFKKKYAIPGLPSYFVIDPASEKAVLRWVGGATVSQLERVLSDGEKAVKARGKGLEEMLARADALYAEGKNAEAAKAYGEVLAQAPKSWKGYGRTIESLIFALQLSQQYEACAKTASVAYPKVRGTSPAVNTAALGLDCAIHLPKGSAVRAELAPPLEKAAREVAADEHLDATGDDRSGVYGVLVSAREEAGDAEGKKKMAEEWAAFLEHSAAKAKTAEERTVYDSHRLSAYLELGQPERAIPMLEASERDLPDDYNPPARLATAYKAMKKWDEALAASDRALEKVYGPRKLLVLRARADIHLGRGDPEAARKTLEDAIALAESFPEGQRSEATIASLKKQRDAMP